MPNHFHLLVDIADERRHLTVRNRLMPSLIVSHPLIRAIASLLSSYSQAINKQNETVGSLFQKKTKAKYLNEGNTNYATTCFHYIHQNPYKAGIVKLMEDWKYSSFKDYAGLRNGTLCNKQLTFELLDLNESNFYSDSYSAIDENKLKKIF